MSKILELTSTAGQKIAVVVGKVTGITEVNKDASSSYGKCFLATGADNDDGGENGWYVAEDYETVRRMLEHCLEN